MTFKEYFETSLMVYQFSKYIPKYYINGKLEVTIDEDGELFPKDLDKFKRNLESEVIDSDIEVDEVRKCVNIRVTLDKWE